MLLFLFYLFLALAFSFLCSILEAVLLTVPLPFLKSKSSQSASAASLLDQKLSIDRPLSAILSLNTIAHTVGAAGVGAQAAIVFQSIPLAVISGVLTLLILVFSEIIPKTIGAKYWRGLVVPTGAILRLLVPAMYPFVLLAEGISRLFPARSDDSLVSREEMSEMAHMGEQAGVFAQSENRIIQSVLRLQTLKVYDIMTPRVVVGRISAEATVQELLDNPKLRIYSRIPVYQKDVDDIQGYVYQQDLFMALADGNPSIKIGPLVKPIEVVLSSQSILSAWELLLEKKQHIALVLDEYGGMDGVVTLEDVTETILDLEIVDENDAVVDLQRFARQRWESRKRKFSL